MVLGRPHLPYMQYLPQTPSRPAYSISFCPAPRTAQDDVSPATLDTASEYYHPGLADVSHAQREREVIEKDEADFKKCGGSAVGRGMGEAKARKTARGSAKLPELAEQE